MGKLKSAYENLAQVLRRDECHYHVEIRFRIANSCTIDGAESLKCSHGIGDGHIFLKTSTRLSL